MRSKIVLGLQFGDEGKGRIVDYLSLSSEKPIVVRFSGGQQVGHTVQLTVQANTIKHIHSNVGSGSLRNIPTYYTEHCCAYLNSLSVELEILKEKGITPKIYYHPKVIMTTPYDQAYNRLIEKINDHGSCGMGIGSTMKRHLTTGYKLYAIDLKYPQIAKAKLDNIGRYYCSIVEEMSISEEMKDYFHDQYQNQLDHYIEQLDKNLFEIQPYSFLVNYETLIFEGSQGILLDMDHGFFPNVTYANTTSKNALSVCQELGISDVQIYYVTRCYQTRHGNGWMSDTGPIKLVNDDGEINIHNEWQGHFRVKELDYSLINYSLEIDSLYHDSLYSYFKIEKNLMVTCLDQRPDFKFDYSILPQDFKIAIEFSDPENNLKNIKTGKKYKFTLSDLESHRITAEIRGHQNGKDNR